MSGLYCSLGKCERIIKIIDEFIESLKAKQASNNTIVSYERDIMKFSNYFEEKGKKIFDLTRDDMLEYIDYLKSEGKSNPTISRSIASIKRLYKYLLSKNLVEENIVENIESPKVDRKDLMILTQDEIEKLLEQPDLSELKGQRDKAMLEVLYSTGIRVTELISLKLEDVNLTNGYIKVKKKNRKIIWIIESLLFIILISLLVLLKIFNPQEREKIEEKSEEIVKPLVIQTQQRKLDLDQLHSSAGIVISLDDGKVIFQFQQDEKIFPASLTKIMTCILAIENINNLEATITLEPEMFDELYAQNASMAGFLPGENAKIIDILYGNILPSGGECSIALAEYVAGSEQAFVELMNEKAKDLGIHYNGRHQ